MVNLIKVSDRGERQSGFSLVEMLVVMGIMGFVMMAVMSLFIPAVRSTSVQTQLTDVQANLRLAMNRLTKDLLLAGFLVDPAYDAGGTLTAGPIYWEGTDPATDFTIRTRVVGDGFARVVGYNSGILTLSDPSMVASFPQNTTVRMFNPMTAAEVDGTVYTVGAPVSANSIRFTSNPASVPDETVVLKIRDGGQPPIQTIRYRVVDGALQRIVNGSTQILARNVSSVQFAYHNSESGLVKRVDATLVGEPVGLGGGGAESSTKNRQLQTSITLRNVY